MRKTSLLDDAALLHFVCAVLAAVGLGLSQDVLFYKSDLASILAVLLLPPLALALPLAAAWGLLRRFVPRPARARVSRDLALLGFTALQAGFVLVLLDRLFLFRSFALFAAAAVALSAALAAFSMRPSQREAVCARMLPLSRALGGLALAFCALWTAGGFPRAKSEKPGKNVVLLVVDGLGASRVPSALSEQALVFSGLRTNKAWTAGYFETLYSGRKDGGAADRGRNLLSLLQERGIRTMWVSFHNDGLPDVFGFPYRGLRASFITQNFAGLARRLGADHNVFLYRRPGYSGKSMGSRQKWLKHRLNAGFEPAPVLDPFLLGEIEALRAGSRPFFLLVHVNVADSGYGLWEDRPQEDEEARAWKEVWDADYSYAPRHEPFVRRWREEYERAAAERLREVSALHEAFRSRGWTRDTLLLVTGDHGKTYSGGRAWYGFHPDDEVARVPLLVFGDGYRGLDARLGETIDLTHTILSAFGVSERLSPESRGLLEPETEPAKPVTTLTRPSPLRREQFLNVYAGRDRYSFDIAQGRQVHGPAPKGFEVGGLLLSYGAER